MMTCNMDLAQYFQAVEELEEHLFDVPKVGPLLAINLSKWRDKGDPADVANNIVHTIDVSLFDSEDYNIFARPYLKNQGHELAEELVIRSDEFSPEEDRAKAATRLREFLDINPYREYSHANVQNVNAFLYHPEFNKGGATVQAISFPNVYIKGPRGHAYELSAHFGGYHDRVYKLGTAQTWTHSSVEWLGDEGINHHISLYDDLEYGVTIGGGQHDRVILPELKTGEDVAVVARVLRDYIVKSDKKRGEMRKEFKVEHTRFVYPVSYYREGYNKNYMAIERDIETMACGSVLKNGQMAKFWHNGDTHMIDATFFITTLEKAEAGERPTEANVCNMENFKRLRNMPELVMSEMINGEFHEFMHHQELFVEVRVLRRQTELEKVIELAEKANKLDKDNKVLKSLCKDGVISKKQYKELIK